ncbi:hypothetical protein CDL15_Pgr001403 [Punica granatum]|uniref:Uncharacterized protein n=1 Tax=Punica granatum TaxID=22663 RepID=A0A218WLC9_PUNGR|nr:hypothetical protein CDL15_Pgr001403 [Punica granatum]
MLRVSQRWLEAPSGRRQSRPRGPASGPQWPNPWESISMLAGVRHLRVHTADDGVGKPGCVAGPNAFVREDAVLAHVELHAMRAERRDQLREVRCSQVGPHQDKNEDDRAN